MAKKKSSKAKLDVLGIIVSVALIVAVAMFFLPFVRCYTTIGTLTSTEILFSGFANAFGSTSVKSVTTIGSNTVTGELEVEAAIMTLISFILVALALVMSLVNLVLCKKHADVKKIISLSIVVLAVAAGVITLVFTKSSFMAANEIGEDSAKYYSLGIGAILSASFAILAGLASLLKSLKK